MTQTIDGDWISDEEIDRLGTFLEHQGFDDEGIDEYFLEHAGVRGMKWGVRKQRRIARQVRRQQRQVDRFRAVASGRGSLGDKTTVALSLPGRDLIKGLEGGAQANLLRRRQIQRDINHGKRKVQSMLIKMGGFHYSEMNFNFAQPR